MRKFLVVFICMLMSLVASAEVINMQAYRYHQKRSYDRSWSSPISCNIQIVIDTDADLIYVNTNRLQYYQVIEYCNTFVDSDGDTTAKFKCCDEEGIGCTVRLVRRRSGTNQIYIDYSNITWVYDVR